MTTCLLKSKIHRACVTGASVDYEGSLTIASDLAERVGLRSYERILVGNLANGERFETYCIYGPAGSGVISRVARVVVPPDLNVWWQPAQPASPRGLKS